MKDGPDEAVPRVLFNVLGPLEVRGGGTPGLYGKPAALLALLLLHASAWVDADQILEALWGQAPPASASRNVKTYVWQLRRCLPPGPGGAPRLEGRRGGYRINVAADELDAGVLEEVARLGWLDADPGRAANRLLGALQLWRGNPFPELPSDITRIATARLEQVRWDVREQLADALVACARYVDAITLLQPLIAEDPLREGLWARLILALSGAGRRGEALSCYQRVRRLLLEELGVDPGPQLREAQRQALTGETPVHGAADRAVPARPSFLPRDIPDFVGRSAEVRALVAAGRTERATPQIAIIEGMPGVGKTALALHVAHQLAGEYPDGQVFYDLHGHDVDTPPAAAADVLAGLLRAFGVPSAAVPGELEERAAMWRSVLSDRRVLVVLDAASSVAQVAPLLPGRGSSLAIVTSRRRMADLPGAHTVTVEPMPERTALALLTSAVADRRVEADRAASVAMVRLCGHLPAAIRVAAVRLRQHPAWSVGMLAQRLERDGGRLAELRTSDRDLSALIAPSYNQLRPAGQRVFRLLAAASLDALAESGCDFDVGEVAAVADVTADEAEFWLEHLLDQYLVVQRAHGRYTMHGLLRHYGRQLAAAEDSPSARQVALARLAELRRATLPVARTA